MSNPELIDEILLRESGGHPAVLAAILERELAVDAIVERNLREGTIENANDPLWGRYICVGRKVMWLKEVTGVPEPPPVTIDKT